MHECSVPPSQCLLQVEPGDEPFFLEHFRPPLTTYRLIPPLTRMANKVKGRLRWAFLQVNLSLFKRIISNEISHRPGCTDVSLDYADGVWTASASA